MRLEILSGAPSKTQALRCFQRIHAPRIMTMFSPFFSFGRFLVALRHQSAKEISWELGTRFCSPNVDRIQYQKSRANTQVVRRYWMFSSSWSQNGQSLGCGSPLLASLSAVQHVFLIANQRKSLHFAGAHDLQTRRQGSKVIEPFKRPDKKTLMKNDLMLLASKGGHLHPGLVLVVQFWKHLGPFFWLLAFCFLNWWK